MGSRKPLGKKIRFQVLKRDRFTCQYCGRKAPDVILEVDHIVPVYMGGDNTFSNLVSSCRDCNRGKGKETLDDVPVDVIHQRTEQMKMYLRWKRDLSNLKKDQVEYLCDYIESIIDKRPKPKGKEILFKCLHEFSFEEVVDAIDIAFYQYDDKRFALTKVPGICNNRRIQKKDKSTYYFNYLRKCFSNRLMYFNEEILKRIVKDDLFGEEDFEFCKKIIPYCSSWTMFLEKFKDRGDEI